MQPHTLISGTHTHTHRDSGTELNRQSQQENSRLEGKSRVGVPDRNMALLLFCPVGGATDTYVPYTTPSDSGRNQAKIDH